MQVRYPSNTYTIEPFGFFFKYKEFTNSNVIYLDKFEDILKMIIAKNIVVDYSDEKKVIYFFEGLNYFGYPIDNFAKQLKLYTYKVEYQNAKKQIIEFLESNIDDESINWDNISKLDLEELFDKYPNKINWNEISQNTNISEAFFERHIHNVEWINLCRNSNISESFFERHIEEVHWWFLCENTNISEAFFERHIEHVHWTRLCRNTNISEAFFERHISNVDWNSLSYNKNISEAFFERYIEHVNWTGLCRNTNISEAFFKKYNSIIDWHNLFLKHNIYETLYENNIGNMRFIIIEFSEPYYSRQNEISLVALNLYKKIKYKKYSQLDIHKTTLHIIENKTYYYFDSIWK